MSIIFHKKKVKCEVFDEKNSKLKNKTKELEDKIKEIKPIYIKKDSPAPISLTSREIEVLKLVSQGKNNKEIGNELFITLATVKAHVSSIINKLNVSGRTEAAFVAREKGLI